MTTTLTPDLKAPAVFVRNRWMPNDAQYKVLEKLKHLRDEHKSAVAFCQAYLPFGASKLSRILDALEPTARQSYFDMIKNPEVLIASLERVVSNIESMPASARPKTNGVHRLKKVRAVIQAVRDCWEINKPRRLIKYLAPTGGGKSMLCDALVEEFHAKVVEVTEDWRKKRSVILKAICIGVGCRIENENDPAQIEEDLVRFANERKIVLVLDECESFGRIAINTVKLLLNKSKMIIVICSIRRAHDRWNMYYSHEADQLARRTKCIVELRDLDPEDVAMFFQKGTFSDARTSLEIIALKGSLFGHFELVQSVADRLDGKSNVPIEEVTKAIRGAAIEMGKAAILFPPVKPIAK